MLGGRLMIFCSLNKSTPRRGWSCVCLTRVLSSASDHVLSAALIMRGMVKIRRLQKKKISPTCSGGACWLSLEGQCKLSMERVALVAVVFPGVPKNAPFQCVCLLSQLTASPPSSTSLPIKLLLC